MTRLPDFGQGSPAKRETRRLALLAAAGFFAVILIAVIWAVVS